MCVDHIWWDVCICTQHMMKKEEPKLKPKRQIKEKTQQISKERYGVRDPKVLEIHLEYLTIMFSARDKKIITVYLLLIFINPTRK